MCVKRVSSWVDHFIEFEIIGYEYSTRYSYCVQYSIFLFHTPSSTQSSLLLFIETSSIENGENRESAERFISVKSLWYLLAMPKLARMGWIDFGGKLNQAHRSKGKKTAAIVSDRLYIAVVSQTGERRTLENVGRNGQCRNFNRSLSLDDLLGSRPSICIFLCPTLNTTEKQQQQSKGETVSVSCVYWRGYLVYEPRGCLKRWLVPPSFRRWWKRRAAYLSLILWYMNFIHGVVWERRRTCERLMGEILYQYAKETKNFTNINQDGRVFLQMGGILTRELNRTMRTFLFLSISVDSSFTVRVLSFWGNRAWTEGDDWT